VSRAMLVIACGQRVQSMVAGLRTADAPVDAADMEPAKVPSDQNAYVYYSHAAAMLIEEPQDIVEANQRLAKTPPREWSSRDVALLRSYVRRNTAAIAIAKRGAELVAYRSPTEWRKGFGATFEFVPRLRSVERQMMYRARVAIADGRLKDAMADCEVGLRLSAHVGSEPAAILQAVEVAFGAQAVKAVRQVLNEARSPDELAALLNMLQRNPVPSHTRSALVGERAFGLAAYNDIIQGRWKTKPLHPRTQLGMALYPSREETRYLDQTRESIELADQPYYRIRRRAEDLSSRIAKVHANKKLLVADVITFDPIGTYRRSAGSRMETAVLTTATAAKLYRARHGSYPNALAELTPHILKQVPIDEFMGKPLIYKRRGDGFVVYSVGQNLKDDGGVETQDKKQGDVVYVE